MLATNPGTLPVPTDGIHLEEKEVGHEDIGPIRACRPVVLANVLDSFSSPCRAGETLRGLLNSRSDGRAATIDIYRWSVLR
jgi:hypothetical protein